MKMQRFKIAKYYGDDAYSWAVFDRLTGKPVVTGCCKVEAQSHQRDLEKKWNS